MNTRKKWSKEEKEFLKNNYCEIPCKKIANKLDRTENSIYSMAHILGLKKKPRNALSWTEEQREEVCKKYKAGGTVKEIAESFEVSTSPILRILKENGVDLKPYKRTRKFSDEKEEKISKEYQNGKSINMLANKYKVSQSLIFSILERNEVKRRSRAKSIELAWKEGRKEGKLHKKTRPGSEELTPAKGFILGVVGPGDGWVSNYPDKRKREIGLGSIDKDFVDTFSNKVEEVYGLKCNFRSEKRDPKWNRMYFAQMSSVAVVKDILRYGKEKHFKHYNERVPSEIMNAGRDIKDSYLRGFYDSQGSPNISGKKRRICAYKSNLTVLKQIAEMLDEYGIDYALGNAGKGREDEKRLVIRRGKSVVKFAETIGFSISRKNEILQKMLSIIS